MVQSSFKPFAPETDSQREGRPSLLFSDVTPSAVTAKNDTCKILLIFLLLFTLLFTFYLSLQCANFADSLIVYVVTCVFGHILNVCVYMSVRVNAFHRRLA